MHRSATRGSLQPWVAAALVAFSLSSADAPAAPNPIPPTWPSIQAEIAEDVVVRVNPALRFVGSREFDVRDVAQARAFYFVETDDAGEVLRRLTVQFEEVYEKAHFAYDYGQRPSETIGGVKFAADAFHYHGYLDYASENPDSDVAASVAFFKDHGATLPDTILVQRFVRVLDEGGRSEMLITYNESPRFAGLDPDDYSDNTRRPDDWESVRDGLHERALEMFAIESASE